MLLCDPTVNLSKVLLEGDTTCIFHQSIIFTVNIFYSIAFFLSYSLVSSVVSYDAFSILILWEFHCIVSLESEIQSRENTFLRVQAGLTKVGHLLHVRLTTENGNGNRKNDGAARFTFACMGPRCRLGWLDTEEQDN